MTKTTPAAVAAAIKEFTDAKKPIPLRLRFLKSHADRKELVARVRGKNA